MKSLPQNIIILIADSLRYDSVKNSNAVPAYLDNNAIQFHEARSAGCWTLPATSSLFTGLSPHEHGATSQTRKIHDHIPTLAEKLSTVGYSTHQVTANIATTHIFGLDRGFDEVVRIWTETRPKFRKFQQALVLFGKPRLRKKLMSKDFLLDKMSEDLNMAKAWMQQMVDDSLAKARKIIKENEEKGKKSFVFINLMETHFPYHVSPVFKFSTPGFFSKFGEAKSLFHTANQTFLKTGKSHISPKKLKVLKNRQVKSWEIIANKVDDFVKEFHEGKDNFVVFGGDHGDAFGEQDWVYHFSNVTDGGNKVPFYILPPGQSKPKHIQEPISTKNIFHTILKYCKEAAEGPSLLGEEGYSEAVLESFWYNNSGKTLQKFKHNQLCFLNGKERFKFADGKWFTAKVIFNGTEPEFKALERGVNPINEFIMDKERKVYLQKLFQSFEQFSKSIKQ